MNIPEQMRAVIIESYKTPPIIKKIPVPIPGKNELLIKVYACPINPAGIV